MLTSSKERDWAGRDSEVGLTSSRGGLWHKWELEWSSSRESRVQAPYPSKRHSASMRIAGVSGRSRYQTACTQKPECPNARSKIMPCLGLESDAWKALAMKLRFRIIPRRQGVLTKLPGAFRAPEVRCAAKKSSETRLDPRNQFHSGGRRISLTPRLRARTPRRASRAR